MNMIKIPVFQVKVGRSVFTILQNRRQVLAKTLCKEHVLENDIACIDRDCPACGVVKLRELLEANVRK